MTENTSLESLTTRAKVYTKRVLQEVFLHDDTHKAVIVYDTDSTLASILSEAYHSNLPTAIFINFNTHTPEQILAVFDALNEKDIVVLIQSKNFRLDAFRIRVELF